jgi:septal ring factor EnvC (AmiA/AmiB activator)
LKEDFSMLEDVDSQLKIYQDDMQRDFTYRMADIENILFEMQQRGDQFFEDTFRLARVLDLLNKSRIQQEFERVVIADVPQRIERKVNEMIDWLVDANLSQWQAVNDHLAERRREHRDRIVGDTVGSFQYDRDRLMDAVGQEARHVIESYDKSYEARQIAEGARDAVAQSAAVEVGAVGLGALITALATTASMDITGILIASLVAALGLFVIPGKRRKAKAEMAEKIEELRNKLSKSLRGQFEREIERSIKDINDAIAPYTRFVRAERSKLEDTQSTLKTIEDQMERLKAQIERM